MSKPIPLLFVKGDIANRPGLALQDVTDRGGHHTKRWKRTGQDSPKPSQAKASDIVSQRDPDPDDKRGSARGYGTHDIQPGGRVKFKAGEHVGQGEITAVGKDGVTVKDSEGREHGIHHHELTHYAPSPDQRGESQGDAARPTAKPLETVLGKQEPIPADQFVAADYAKSHDQADVTPESILAGFPPDTKSRIAAAQERLKGIEETINEFRKDGKWKAEREIIHATIKAKILSPERRKAATPPAGQKPTFMILGGRGGSGKSSFNGLVYDPSKFIVLDADHIKSLLPEYEGWNAFCLHEESSYLFDEITNLAQTLGLNIVHDATMKTTDKAVALVKRFKDAGYNTEAHYMYLPRQEAAKRAVSRFRRGGEKGRYVPVAVALANKTNEASFDAVKPLVNKWSFRDNNVPQGDQPILISESGKGGKSGDKGQGVESPMNKALQNLAQKNIIKLLFRSPA